MSGKDVTTFLNFTTISLHLLFQKNILILFLKGFPNLLYIKGLYLFNQVIKTNGYFMIGDFSYEVYSSLFFDR